MDAIKSQKIPLFFLLLIFIFAWHFQNVFWINWDVSWDLIVTQKLLAGGTYSQDFFDLNPPLFFFLYTPIIFLKHILPIKLDIALRLYFFSLTICSLLVCQKIVKEIFPREDKLIESLALLTLGFIFLIVPNYEFGQREHLLLLFCLPYLLAVMPTLQGRKTLPAFAILIGLIGFAGFAIKPYFLLSLVFVELYVMYRTKNIFVSLRLETITLAIALMLYLIAIYIFYPDYINIVMPIAVKYYHAGFVDPTAMVWLRPELLFCEFAILFSCVYLFLSQNKNDYVDFIAVLLAALIGFILSYFLQNTSWFYHIMPAYALAILLVIMLFGMLIKKINNYTLSLSFFGVAIVFFIFWQTYTPYLVMTDYKKVNQSLVSFIKTYANNKKVMVFSTIGNEFFSEIYYGHAQPASRFMHFFWIPAIVKNKSLKVPFLQQQQDQEILTNDLAEDLEVNKPTLVFVDVRKYKPYLTAVAFEYLPYFLKNKNFSHQWLHYRYLTTLERKPTNININGYVLYKYAVYIRV